MLAREFGAWPELVAAKQKDTLVGKKGIVHLHPGDIVAVYKLSDGNVMLASQDSMAIATPEDAQKALGLDVSSAPKVNADTSAALQAFTQAKAWNYYIQNYQLPDHIDGLVDANGQPVDLHKFFTDRNYAVKVVSGYLNSPIIMRKGKTIPFRRRINKDPNRIVDALYALYYGMRFDPAMTMFGKFGPDFWKDGADIKANGTGWAVSFDNPWIFTPPFVDDHNDIHSNMDIRPSNPSSAILYNPFTQPVKVKNVWLWYDRRKFRTFRQAYEAGALNASIHGVVTPPDGGKPVEFYFAHLKAEKGFGIWNYLDPMKASLLSGANAVIRVNEKFSIKPGEPISHLDNPKDDPLSQGWHVEFGVTLRNGYKHYGIEDYRIATLMATAMLYHPNPEQYLPPLPPAPEQGYWFGKKHVVSYQPTVPAVAVKQPNGTIAFANINLNKKEPGWKKQLPASARFSKYPKSAFHKRA